MFVLASNVPDTMPPLRIAQAFGREFGESCRLLGTEFTIPQVGCFAVGIELPGKGAKSAILNRMRGWVAGYVACWSEANQREVAL